MDSEKFWVVGMMDSDGRIKLYEKPEHLRSEQAAIIRAEENMKRYGKPFFVLECVGIYMMPTQPSLFRRF